MLASRSSFRVSTLAAVLRARTLQRRHLSTPPPTKRSAYILPIDPDATLSPNTDSETLLGSALRQWAKTTPVTPKAGTLRTFYDDEGSSLTLVSLGPETARKVPLHEAVRSSVGKGVRVAVSEDLEASEVHVATHRHVHAASVAAHLAQYKFDAMKSEKTLLAAELIPFGPGAEEEMDGLSWETGRTYAKAQNFARTVMELPGNKLTPTTFCDKVVDAFKAFEIDTSNIKIDIHEQEWAEKQKMNAFLAVARGSAEPLKFLEIEYKGAADDSAPLMLVGKGVTFDSGGISIKPSADMKLMRGDMGGAATVVSAALGVAMLKLPINLIVLVPLTENMPSGTAVKPGDIITARNGKTIEIDNTDAEGRLILADALHYGSTTYDPHTIIDVATLTGAMVIALGSQYSGVYSSSDSLWHELHAAGEAEYDRFWRMPLDHAYAEQIGGSNADLCNVGGRAGGACTAAWFLRNFVDGIDSANAARWAHIDIAGVHGGDEGQRVPASWDDWATDQSAIGVCSS